MRKFLNRLRHRIFFPIKPEQRPVPCPACERGDSVPQAEGEGYFDVLAGSELDIGLFRRCGHELEFSWYERERVTIEEDRPWMVTFAIDEAVEVFAAGTFRLEGSLVRFSRFRQRLGPLWPLDKLDVSEADYHERAKR